MTTDLVLIDEKTIMYYIRGEYVMTDRDLANLYGYSTRKFNEQGIYMLMTVLKGDLAIKQSKVLIRVFKKMKDYLINKDIVYCIYEGKELEK